MRSEAQKRADKKWQQSEKDKAAHKRYWQSDKGKNALRRYQQSDNGRIAQARANAERKGLGYNPINKWFSEACSHHINEEDIIYIPKSLHDSISHSQDNSESMRAMNNAAFEWFYINEVI